MNHLLKLFLILIIAGIYPMATIFLAGTISDNLIFYYYPYLYNIVIFWLFGIWYFGFLIYGMITFWRNVGQSHFMVKFVVPIILIIVSLLGFVGLSSLGLFISLFNSPHKLEYKCDGYDITSKASGNEGVAKYYYAVKNNSVVRIGDKEYLRDCQVKIILNIPEGIYNSYNSSNYTYIYTSPFATQAEIANTLAVKSILDSNPNARITEYEQGSYVTISIK